MTSKMIEQRKVRKKFKNNQPLINVSPINLAKEQVNAKIILLQNDQRNHEKF